MGQILWTLRVEYLMSSGDRAERVDVVLQGSSGIPFIKFCQLPALKRRHYNPSV
jgi:hypothetical protein